MIRAVLLDIEGTVGPVSFVHEVLFPYAEERVRDYVLMRYEEPEMREIIERLYREYQHEKEPAPAWVAVEDEEGAVSYLEWLMERDRKSTALKEVQGLIWESGFESGELKGALFSDVPEALSRWTQAGLKVAIFSSGSVLAQKLYFKYSEFGDLSGLLNGHFDTTTGPKREADSYLTIATSLRLPAEEILFVSDVPEELEAANNAGMEVRLALRPGNKPVGEHPWGAVQSFNAITP